MTNEVWMDVLTNLAYSGGGFALGYLAAHEVKINLPRLSFRGPRDRRSDRK